MLPKYRAAASIAPDKAGPDAFALLSGASHQAATSPWSAHADPTAAQAAANVYKVGRMVWHGLPIRIENPAHSIREGTDPGGKPWRNMMQAAYGDFAGTKGADGDCVDLFMGPFPESRRVWVLNQRAADGSFDEHKVLCGFVDEAAALSAYRYSYSPGWDRGGPATRITLDQLKWWLKWADTTRPFSLDLIPPEPDMTDDTLAPAAPDLTRVFWDSAAQPLGKTLGQVLYLCRANDGADGLILDPMTMGELLAGEEVLRMDALMTLVGKLEPKMAAMMRVMEAAGADVKPLAFQISEPIRRHGGVHVAVLFELSDGQTITIWFHNPDLTPAKLSIADTLVSWKWLLNKKDITIVVAPESGADLDGREVARRLMRLAAKNSAAFARVNAKRAATMSEIEGLKGTLAAKQGELQGLLGQIEVAKVAREDRKAAEPDLSHLNALEFRLSNERQRLAAATDPKDIELRKVWVGQIEREIADERARLGLPPAAEVPAMTDDELAAELAAPQAVPVSKETIALLAEAAGAVHDVQMVTPGGSVEFASISVRGITGSLEWVKDEAQYRMSSFASDRDSFDQKGADPGPLIRAFAAWVNSITPAGVVAAPATGAPEPVEGVPPNDPTVPDDVLALPEGTYSEWEDKITTIIEFREGATRSDAQGMVEAQAFYMQQQWSLGTKAMEAYTAIWGPGGKLARDAAKPQTSDLWRKISAKEWRITALDGSEWVVAKVGSKWLTEAGQSFIDLDAAMLAVEDSIAARARTAAEEAASRATAGMLDITQASQDALLDANKRLGGLNQYEYATFTSDPKWATIVKDKPADPALAALHYGKLEVEQELQRRRDAGPAPAVEVFPFDQATDEARALFAIGATDPSLSNAYRTAIRIEKEAADQGMTVAWDVTDTLPVVEEAAMDSADGDADDEGEDFDAEEEFAAMPEDEEEEEGAAA